MIRVLNPNQPWLLHWICNYFDLLLSLIVKVSECCYMAIVNYSKNAIVIEGLCSRFSLYLTLIGPRYLHETFQCFEQAIKQSLCSTFDCRFSQ